jgi:hypothetical protein
VLSCVGRGLGAGLIPRPRNPIKYLKDPQVKKKNPTRHKENEKEDLDVDGKIYIKMYLREIGCEVVDWMHLARDRDQWRVLLNTVMKIRVP